jgi:hypothetical protein
MSVYKRLNPNRTSKVDHQCTAPPADRDWDRIPSTEYAITGKPLNEIWKCRSCGYEFELKRAREVFRPISRWPRLH